MSATARNLIYLVVSQVATWAITMVVFLVAPGRLGPDDFGRYGFAASYLGFFTLLASLGVTPLLVRTVARDRAQFGPLVASAVALKVVSGVTLTALAVALAPLFGADGVTLWLVLLGGAGMLFTVVNDVYVGAEAGRERMGRTAWWSTVQVYVGSVAAIALLVLGAGVVPFAAALAVATVIPVIANGRAVAGEVHGERRVDLARWRFLITGGLPLMALHGLFRIYGTIDVPIMARMANHETVGWYTLAYRLVTIPIFIATTSVRAFAPSFAAHAGRSDAEFGRQVNRAVRLVTLVALPTAAGIGLVAGDLIGMLYDERYANSIALVQILSAHIPFVAVGMVLGTALVAADRQGPYLKVAGVGALLSPAAYVLGMWWAERRYDNAAIGAAIATVVLEVALFAGAVVIRAPGVLDRPTVSFMARAVAATGVMVGAVVAVDGSLPVEVAVGSIVFVLAAAGLRVVRPADVTGLFDRLGAGRSAPSSATPSSEVAREEAMT